MTNIKILNPDGEGIHPITNEPYSDKYKELAKKWSNLPAYNKSQQIIDAIRDNQIVLISSGTGSGKTLLTPKYALEVLGNTAKIAITLPKQILTVSNASYQADISDLKLGKHVGYVYKGSDKKYSNSENILLYATDGTIVAKALRDPELKEFNCVIIDEAHERKVQIDFLLYLLKQTCNLREDFKLIIMSATVNHEIFQEYFEGHKFKYLHVGSETNYPITSIFTDEPVDDKSYMNKGFEIIEKIMNTTKDGDILFFVTSVQETIDACKRVGLDFKDLDLYCAEVYAGIKKDAQELAQDENLYKEKSGKNRKIVIATNVAESSLTIANIKFVIDAGYELSSYFDTEKRSKVLQKQRITLAQAMQRMGRSGRTGPGTCYHLYTKNDFENIMMKYPPPAIRVNNIYGECLKLLNLPNANNINFSEVSTLKRILNELIEPPTEEYVNFSITTLMKLGLIENGKTTNLGKIIGNMQTDPTSSLAIYASYHLDCLNEVLSIICICDTIKNHLNDLFNAPSNKHMGKDSLYSKFTKEKRKMFSVGGDHLSILKIFNKYLKLRKDVHDEREKNKDVYKNKKSSLDKWMYESFLSRDILDKCFKNVKKMKNNIIEDFREFDKKKIDNLSSYDLNDKIMASLMYGFKLQIGFLKDSSYNTPGITNVQIAKESFMNYYPEKKKEVLYN